MTDTKPGPNRIPHDYFAGDVAARYDDDHRRDDAGTAVSVLAELAAGGPALEFAIGTGRVALPLAETGIKVLGIELSPDMIAQLRAKPGGGLPVVEGDITTAHVPGSFNLVYLVFNTINNLTRQEDQIACFANAARHLSPDGAFVVEVQVPPLQRLPEGERLLAFACDDTYFGTDEIDVVTQSFLSHHCWSDANETRRLSIPMRYVWPSELDLMARLAGMTLAHRWGDRTKAPFSATSRSHVSVWRKDA
ncbi:MAG: class I SAM-dependent methyltransferase [Pseudomonadota bacterium]